MLWKTGKKGLVKNQVNMKATFKNDLRDYAQQSVTSSFPVPGV